MKLPSVLGAIALLAASPAAAQFAPTLDEGATLVEELVVRAYGGPAWWRVSDANNTVFVLADPGFIPDGVSFDQTLLERRLENARELILPPTADIGPMALLASRGFGRLTNQLNYSEANELEPALPPAIRDRFVAIRDQIGRPATRYGALSPGLAASALYGDFIAYQNEQNGQRQSVSGTTVQNVLRTVAERHGVRVRHADTFGGLLLSRIVGDLDKPGMDCLTQTLDLIENNGRASAPATPRNSAVEAWAEGDIRPLLDLARTAGNPTFSFNMINGDRSTHIRVATESCQRAMPAIMSVRQRYVDSQTDAIARVLRGRQDAVALVDSVSLVMTGGVLDRLRAQGFTVIAPGEPLPD